MIRFGNKPIDIGPLIRGAETATLIASRMMVGTGSAVLDDSPFAIEKREWDSPLFNQIYSELSLFGSSILGNAGLIVAFGDHVIAGDHAGSQPISGNPVSMTGRFVRISSVFLEKAVLVGGEYETNVVPAMEFTVTDIPMEHSSDSGSDGTVLRLPRVSFPLLGQTPQVYEYARAF